MNLRLYTDGGARNNPGPGAIGVLVCDEDDEEIARHEAFIGESTNNIAEYCALIAGLELVSQYSPIKLRCFLDSELVVNQLNGAYKVKNIRIKRLYQEIKCQEARFSNISYAYLPRTHEKMKIVDKMVNKVLNDEERK